MSKRANLADQISALPALHVTKSSRHFVMCNFKRAEKVLELNEELAIKSLAESLLILSCEEADRLLSHMRRKLLPKMYCKLYRKYTELRNV